MVSRSFIVALIGVLGCLILSGCVHEEDGGASSTLPWSRPASWEDQQLGIPL